MSEVKRHYYCFSYSGRDSLGNSYEANTYTGYKEKEITLSIINENKVYAGVSTNAVLISVSYLGYMTVEAFTGK